jgi:hypothetical protein
MVPSAIVLLPRLPLNANGKIDRQALPAPEQVREGGASRPRGPVEELIAGIWSEVLQRTELVGVEQSFFELGGHSLMATQVASRLRAALGMEVPVAWLFEAPTVAGLALRIEQSQREQQGLLAPPLLPVSRARALPLSFAQQRLWFLDQWNPGSHFYNLHTSVRIDGPLDVAVFERALNMLVARHETLRTIFPAEEGRPVQVILPALTIEVSARDLGGATEGASLEAASELAVAEVQRPFDLARGPLIRALLLRLEPASHVLVLSMHHIVSDGWSTAVLIPELVALYDACRNGAAAALAPLPIQYADYACWQREWLQGDVLARQLAYWKERLWDAPSLDLRTDYRRPAVQAFRGRRKAVEIDRELTAAVRSLCRREGATLFMTLLAAFKVLLRHYTDRSRIVVGTNSANRNRLEIEGLIGFFVNQLVLLTDLSGEPSFREVLGRVRQTVLGAFAHQELPFEQVVAELRPDRSASHSPLYQVLFTLQAARAAHEAPAGLRIADFPVPQGAAKFDLVLTTVDRGDTLVASFEYDVDLYADATIDGMLAHYERVLRAVVSQPDLRLGGVLEILGRAETEAKAAALAEFQAADVERLRGLRSARRASGGPSPAFRE